METEQKEHDELLALYEDAGRNIEHAKQNSRVYLLYYSGITVALYHLYLPSDSEQSRHVLPAWIIILLLLVATAVCMATICDTRSVLLKRSGVLQRLFGKHFSKKMRECRDPRDHNVINKGYSDRLFFYVSLLYPVLVYAIASCVLKCGEPCICIFVAGFIYAYCWEHDYRIAISHQSEAFLARK